MYGESEIHFRQRWFRWHRRWSFYIVNLSQCNQSALVINFYNFTNFQLCSCKFILNNSYIIFVNTSLQLSDLPFWFLRHSQCCLPIQNPHVIFFFKIYHELNLIGFCVESETEQLWLSLVCWRGLLNVHWFISDSLDHMKMGPMKTQSSYKKYVCSFISSYKSCLSYRK